MKKSILFLVMLLVSSISMLAQGVDGSKLPTNTTVRIGTAQKNVVPNKWYFLHSPRNQNSTATAFDINGQIQCSGGLVSDNGEGKAPLLSETTLIESLVSDAGVNVADVYSSMVRFHPVDGLDNVYTIEFATGNWVGENLKIVSNASDAFQFNFYLIKNQTDEQPNTAGRFGWNKFDMADRVDNNGASHPVVFWGEGESIGSELDLGGDNENIKGNRVWQIYNIELAGTDLPKDKLIKIGSAQKKVVAGQWYFLHNPRLPNSSATEFDVDGQIQRAGGLVTDMGNFRQPLMTGTSIIDKLTSEEGVNAAKYYASMVAFHPVEGKENVYKIEFGTGNWLGAGNQPVSVDKVGHAAGLSVEYNFYLIKNETDGQPNTAGRFGWNKFDMADRVDNNGAGHPVVFWGEGESIGSELDLGGDNENIKGNRVWQIYSIEVVADLDKWKEAFNDLVDNFATISGFTTSNGELLVTSLANGENVGNNYGNYRPELVASFLALHDQVSKLMDLADASGIETIKGQYTAEELEELVLAYNNAYLQVVQNKVPLAMSTIEPGYYYIKSAAANFWHSDEMAIKVNLGDNGSAASAWGLWEFHPDFLWKIERFDGDASGTQYTLYNVGQKVYFVGINQSEATAMTTTPTAVCFDYRGEQNVPLLEEMKTAINIRAAAHPENGYNYIHAGGHRNGAGTGSWCVGWADSNVTRWYMQAVSEAEVEALLNDSENPDDENPDDENPDNENPDNENPDNDAPYSLFANDVIGAKAGSQIELAIQVKNPEMDFTSCQFDLVLPEGIEIAKNQKGKYIVTTADRTEDHEILTKPIDGAMQIAMYSMSNEVFYGQEGAVMYLTINVSKELENGDYVCNIKNIILNDTNVKEYKPADTKFTINIASYTPGDVNNDGVINVTDISGVVAIWLGTASSNLNFKAADTNNDNQITVTDISGVISIFLNGNSSRMATRTSDASSDTEEYTSMYFAQPLEARQGEEVELAILLNNPGIDFVSAQFDLVLPAGIEISKNKKGKLIIEGTDRTEEHEILHKNVDGATQIALYSMSNEVFWGNEGAILVITLIVDEDMAHGAYDILLKNQILVDPNINENRPADFTGKINIGTDTGIGNIGESHSGKNVYDMQGRRTKAKQHGVYIINNKKVVK